MSSLSLTFLINKTRFKSNPLLPDCQGDCEDLKEKEKDSTSETQSYEGLRNPRKGLKEARAPGKCMLGVIWVPRKLPGKGLPGAAPSIVSSARGTTAIAWRRKETQTREKEGSTKEGRAGGRGFRAGYLRWPPWTMRLPNHLLSSSRLSARPQVALGSWARARPTTPILRHQTPTHLHTYAEGMEAGVGEACPQGLA